MNEFIGRVIYPFLFSASLRLTSAVRLTHAFMSLTGMWCSFSVIILNGAVSFGVFAFSPLAALVFLAFGVGFG
jgi:hypothetical protein